MRMLKLFLVLGLLLATTCASGDDFTVYNTDSGWFTADGYHTGGNPNYASSVSRYNYFSFDLSNVSGTVTAASLTLLTYDIWGPGIYTLYGTALSPSQVASGNTYTDVSLYNALVDGPNIGFIALDPSQSGRWVIITLNAAGLAFLSSNQGNQIVIGGSFPSTIAFGGSWFTGDNNLLISATPTPDPSVPEPGSMLLLASGCLGLFSRRRKRVHK